MLKQPTEIKVDEEIDLDIGSSLANIGMDLTSRKYDSVLPNPTTDLDDKSSSTDVDRVECAGDDMLLDGDATPKVSRVSIPVIDYTYLIEYYAFCL